MLSPDDTCVKSLDVPSQVEVCSESETPSKKFRERINAGEESKCRCEPSRIRVESKGDNDESSKPSCSRLEKNENRSEKFFEASKQQRKHFPKRKLINALCQSGNKIIRLRALNYIKVLENTVKKQRNVIRYLKLKLETLEHNAETNLVQNVGNVTHKPKNRVAERDIPRLDKIESSKLERGINVRSGLQSQKKNTNMGNSVCDILCEDMEITEKDLEIQSRLNSYNNKKLCKDGDNVPITSDQLMYSDDMDFIEDNLKEEIIESDSKVFLQSDELRNKNADIEEEVDEEVRKCVEEFMCREDVSVVDLNVKNLKQNEKVTRYRRHFLGVLYKQFLAEVNSKCSYIQFCKYIPKNVVKPTPPYWKILICQRCENAELKFMEVINKVLLRKDLLLEEVLAKQDLYEHVSQELSKLKNSQKPFTYMTWAKTLLGKMEANERIVTTTIGSACTDLLKELDLLKEHLNRCYNQYEAVREAREDTEISPIHAIVHIDWYESPATFVARHLHTSYYYGDGFKTLHAGFVRTKEKSFGFASLSDCRDHTAPAVWASINHILVSLAKDGMKVITIVSDSATAQYRNKGNFYLMRRFAKQNNVEVKWIYLEGGHGKGIADAIGASIKQIMCDTIAHHPNKSFRNTMDVLPIIKDLTPVKVSTHTDHLVQQYKNLLSRQHLQVIPSTYKIHEVCVKETAFYVKESSADKLPFFSLEIQNMFL